MQEYDDRYLPSRYGWRRWRYDEQGLLRSPDRGTPWETQTLQAHAWRVDQEVEGKAGVHAVRCPKGWKTRPAYWPERLHEVTGLVERSGRAVVGPTGWRAERATILALVAPSHQVAAALARRYPGITVWVGRQAAMSRLLRVAP